MKSYIVLGLGRFGTEVARRLCELGCEVLAVDSKSELVQQLGNEVTQAVVADVRTDGSKLHAGAQIYAQLPADHVLHHGIVRPVAGAGIPSPMLHT